jgi:UDP-N-acetylglucosamine/UDP-N-acetylgalactosamine diphosphorylase
MTSEGDNHAHTTTFFKEHKYFGYGSQNVTFFPQGTLPCMTEEGKLMLETGFKVGSAADGNGGIYGALKASGSLQSMKERGVKCVHVFSVDNAIGKVCDPAFIGYCASRGADVGNKVVWKVSPDEKVGVIGKRGGKNSVIEYSEMSTADCAKTDASGKLMYGAGNICNHFCECLG